MIYLKLRPVKLFKYANVLLFYLTISSSLRD